MYGQTTCEPAPQKDGGWIKPDKETITSMIGQIEETLDKTKNTLDFIIAALLGQDPPVDTKTQHKFGLVDRTFELLDNAKQTADMAEYIRNMVI